jgi:hypothetical protein
MFMTRLQAMAFKRAIKQSLKHDKHPRVLNYNIQKRLGLIKNIRKEHKNFFVPDYLK